MKYAIVNLGCKVNRVESDSFSASLAARGCVEAPEENAELIVVNTCTVTGEAEKKTRKAVRHALRASEGATVVVTGCAAAIDAEVFTQMSDRIRVMGKAALAAAIDAGAFGDAEAVHGKALPVGEGFRTRVGVKVQDGCNNACTYCIVHVARGRAASVDADKVVETCKAISAAGVGEIVLTGINLGSYCWGDRRSENAVRLPDLLKRLLAETERPPAGRACPTRFRISSIEPRDVDDALIDVLAASEGRVCRHLHLPLQAGSTKVLREMHRPYTAEQFVSLVQRLYERVPELSLSTDIICGFPGETEAEFEETLDLARACRFSKIHVFPYSLRTGTPAAARTDQVAPEVKAERAARLRSLADELRAAELARRRGTRELAVVEGEGTALTESYFEVPAPAGSRPGDVVEVTL